MEKNTSTMTQQTINSFHSRHFHSHMLGLWKLLWQVLVEVGDLEVQLWKLRELFADDVFVDTDGSEKGAGNGG